MTIEELKKMKQQKGYSYAMMSELSGVPLGTIQKIFSGETEHPRYDTLQALEKIFQPQTVLHVLREERGYYAAPQLKKTGAYTVEDYYALPEEQRVELIDGIFYDMAAPTSLHQRMIGEIFFQITNFIRQNKKGCEPLLSPFDIQLDCDEKTMVQPDIAILCDIGKLKKWGVYGAPDFMLEVISPSSRRKDYTIKMSKYMAAGVREYWIVDPYQYKVVVYFFESEAYPIIYGFDKPIPVNIFEGKLQIEMEGIAAWTKEFEEMKE